MGQILTIDAQLMCPHGGTVSLSSTQSSVQVAGGLVLRPIDVFIVAGCAFTLPPAVPSPCVSVQWEAESVVTMVGGAGVLTTDSVGLCLAADQTPQGSVIIAETQTQGASQ